MTTKLTVAPSKWENDSVKGRCKRKKGKGKRKRGFPIFHFRFKTNKGSGKFISHFPFSSHFPESKHALNEFHNSLVHVRVIGGWNIRSLSKTNITVQIFLPKPF